MRPVHRGSQILSNFPIDGGRGGARLGWIGRANTLKNTRVVSPCWSPNPASARWGGLLLPVQADDLRTLPPKLLLGVAPIRETTKARTRLSDGQSLLAVNDFFVGGARTQGRPDTSYHMASGRSAGRPAASLFPRPVLNRLVTQRADGSQSYRWPINGSSLVFVSQLSVCSLRLIGGVISTDKMGSSDLAF